MFKIISNYSYFTTAVLMDTLYNTDNTYLISALNLFILFITTIFIIVLAYFTTKILSKKVNYLNSKGNIKIIEKLSLGLDKTLVLIELNNIFYLISVTKNNIELIDRINELELKDFDDISLDFKSILSKITKNK